MSFDDRNGPPKRAQKHGNHTRAGLPRVLWMSMLPDLNRDFNPREIAYFKAQDEDHKRPEERQP